jgi:organic hydroperoxide reductase OsmC/OhrA
MSLHRASTSWRRSTADFAYDTYDRTHAWTFGGGVRIEASAASEYKGRAELPNPEEALVAAISSCHMLTFLAICARKNIVVDAYDDDADGHLEKNAEGRLALTRVTLRPRAVFAPGTPVDAPTLARLHEAAHRGCFIAASVKTEITVEPR